MQHVIMEHSFGELFGSSIFNRKIKTYAVGSYKTIIQVIEYPDGALAERKMQDNGQWAKWEMAERFEIKTRIRRGIYTEVWPPFPYSLKINPQRVFKL